MINQQKGTLSLLPICVRICSQQIFDFLSLSLSTDDELELLRSPLMLESDCFIIIVFFCATDE
jgi:hypothetical protein